MLIACTNKGCLKTSNALLDPETLEVICEECGQPISGISDAMKRTLKSFGQVIRSERKAFMLACHTCKANREVVMDQDNNTICKTCHNKIEVHAAFKLAMEEAGGLERINTEEVKEETPKKKKAVRRKKKA